MLTLVVILKALAEIAGLALVGQGILYVLAGAGREKNLFYRILKSMTAPVVKAMRFITPRFVSDQHVPLVAFFFVAGLWLALSIEKVQLCRENPAHPACAGLEPRPAGEAPAPH
jgi:hypothetical protein